MSNKQGGHVYLQKLQKEREDRLSEKVKNTATTKIQKWMRNVTGRLKVFRVLRSEVSDFLEKSPQSGVDIFLTGRKLLFIYNPQVDSETFLCYCQVLLASMESSNVKMWYVAVSLNKVYAVAWIHQIKEILGIACGNLQGLKPGKPKEDRLISVYLNMFITFTDYTLWKFTLKAGDALKPTLHKMCCSFITHLVEKKHLYSSLNELLLNGLGCSEPKLSRHMLPAAMGIRALALCQFPSPMMCLFVHHVLTVPACVLHLHVLSPETFAQLEKVSFVLRVVNVLNSANCLLNGLSGSEALSLFANILYMGSIHIKVLVEHNKLEQFLDVHVWHHFIRLWVKAVLYDILPLCHANKSSKQTTSSSWHFVFGWCKITIDPRIQESVNQVRKQLQYLWNPNFVNSVFAPVLALSPAPVQTEKGIKFRLNRLSRHANTTLQLKTEVLERVCNICSMYDCCLSTLQQMNAELLTGLSCNGMLVCKMWLFIRGVFGCDPSKVLQSVQQSTANCQPQLWRILVLFCQLALYLIAVQDNQELLEECHYFSVSELIEMSSFLNRLVFKLIWSERCLQSSSPPSALSSLLTHSHSLLLLLYNRDARKQFCPEDHWLIKELKVSHFMSELMAKKPYAVELLQKLPHSIPHRQRVEIFHQTVSDDRKSLGIGNPRDHSSRGPATYVTVHRGRVLEDGFTQLSSVPTRALKGLIRVKFVNEQGLDEAGIDELGVFKEFLEEIIKIAFDPGLNLFKVSSDGHIYPSPTSHIHDNHLALFEFVGKMLGKAVYEGIVMEIPFAVFFLNQLMGQQNSVLYSSLDELFSMDPELHKSLSYVKHCEDDVSDLCLSFSWDEDFMGKVVTHELVPGGSGISVTNENRISYVHRMSHFCMHTQLKQQTVAFVQGFHSLISKAWLSLFSPHEVQRLISGDQVVIDIDDLRKHTQYFGGYHDKHRVVSWLWDTLRSDFTEQERASFLKFVTSCSKPPLLGFAHLEPPFSIRCVQLAEEEDRGDSLPSVLRGFFSTRKQGAKDRLPTASTCFNLLKLPNYGKKSVLREKLRYAVSCNAGFELS